LVEGRLVEGRLMEGRLMEGRVASSQTHTQPLALRHAVGRANPRGSGAVPSRREAGGVVATWQGRGKGLAGTWQKGEFFLTESGM
jgi:hypothetical protein